ncbi:MAG: hypothetical protein RMJ53_00470 [Chitinophagales bacterium]|nr:hypothetical protein [Chitinophagales bacterium]
MMWSLEKAGKLKHLSALVAGGFTDMKDNTTPFGKTARRLLLNILQNIHILFVLAHRQGILRIIGLWY